MTVLTADSGIERCDISLTHHMSRIFMGRVCKYFTGYCPLSYCARNTNSFLHRLQPIKEAFCAPVNRMGQVCGECKEDFGVAANSDERKCIKCQNGN